jgi:hypothetical protein
MQPTFLPWAGYFRLMLDVDQFVYLDDVNLSQGRSWQTRNRIIVSKKAQWLTAPVLRAGGPQRLKDVCLSPDPRWRRKIVQTFRLNYARHEFQADVEPALDIIEQGSDTNLVELNVRLIELFAKHLQIETPRVRSGDLNIGAADRTDRLIAICRKLDCGGYLSPRGSESYLEEDGFLERCDISLEFTDYRPPPYGQRGISDFVSHLSIVDVVANLGWRQAAQYIRANWPSEGNVP